jgi:hypothetical protein
LNRFLAALENHRRIWQGGIAIAVGFSELTFLHIVAANSRRNG